MFFFRLSISNNMECGNAFARHADVGRGIFFLISNSMQMQTAFARNSGQRHQNMSVLMQRSLIQKYKWVTCHMPGRFSRNGLELELLPVQRCNIFPNSANEPKQQIKIDAFQCRIALAR